MKMKTKIFVLFCAMALILLGGQGCRQSTSQEAASRVAPVTLRYWRVFDSEDDFAEIIEAYNAKHPHIDIEYREFSIDEYEDELIDALAEDRGPDIFTIQNTQMREYKNKLLALPPSVVMPFTQVQGGLSQEVIVTLQELPSITLRQLRDNFVDTVFDDVVLTDITPQGEFQRIYGLPLSVDTLAMFYNRDLLNNAGIAQPAANWEDVQDHVRKITQVDRQNNVVLSGAALGTSRNIPQSSDILSLIMMQNGAVMQDEFGDIRFAQIPEDLRERDIAPGLEALIFYTDFASPTKVVYTWNAQLPNALDEFIAGNVAYYFGYSYDVDQIKQRAPRLNFSTAKMPQIVGNPAVNYAEYWVEVVSNKTEHSDEAWDFLQFVASADQVVHYLDNTKKPTALLSLVDAQRNDLDISVFADQVLTAKNWYHGSDSREVESIFYNMIEQTLDGTRDVEEIISIGASQVARTIE